MGENHVNILSGTRHVANDEGRFWTDKNLKQFLLTANRRLKMNSKYLMNFIPVSIVS